jgi:hypothetical protein
MHVLCKAMKFARGDSDSSAPAKKIDDGKKHDCSEKRNQESWQTEVGLIDRTDADQWRNEPPADHRSHDADDDIQDDALLTVGLHENARQPAKDPAYHKPQDKIHEVASSSEV